MLITGDANAEGKLHWAFGGFSVESGFWKPLVECLYYRHIFIAVWSIQLYSFMKY